MKLQTKITIQKEISKPIDYHSKIVLLGSCFSENIGNLFKKFQFQTIQNPFGILFHPTAIENLIINAIQNKEYVVDDLIYKNEKWHSFDAHSSLSSIDENKMLENLNTKLSSTKNALQNASHIIITLGTAWVYRFLETNSIVANCHKIPQKKFEKELLSIESIIESFKNCLALMQSINQNVQIIVTVSPVRHIKDGFIENMRSKSHLISAIHQVIENSNSEHQFRNINYFPSYEILIDELRDYRFYKEDMLHPNQTAINYVWEKFTQTWFTSSTENTMQKVEEVNKGLAHKPFNEYSNTHQEFLKKLAQKTNELQTEFPFMQF